MTRWTDIRNVIYFLAFVIFITTSNGKYKYHEHDWNYDKRGNTGPSSWHKKYPQCIGEGKRQSPISIWPKDLETADQGTSRRNHWLNFVNYEKTLDNLVLTNTGHNILIEIPHDKAKLEFTSSFLDSSYVLNNIHFHWGTTSREGSEHTFATHSFPFEMHLVHFNTKAKEPMESPTGVLVIGVFFEVGKKEKANEEIHKIADKLNLISLSGEKTVLNDIKVLNLLPENRQKILRYNGSLTTPPCAEVVDWIIFPHTAYITNEDLYSFARLLPNMTKRMGNFRPVQPLEKRKILLYTALDTSKDGGTCKYFHLAVFLVMLLHVFRI